MKIHKKQKKEKNYKMRKLHKKYIYILCIMANPDQEQEQDDLQRTFIHTIPNKDTLLSILKENTGILVLKFGATWCKPCKQIEEYINYKFSEVGENVLCGSIDIDKNFEVYAFLKKKKVVQSIPTIVRYDCGNITFIPDDVITGTDIAKLDMFFDDIMED